MVELIEQVGSGSFSDLGSAAGYENNLALKGTFGFGPSFQLGFFGEKNKQDNYICQVLHFLAKKIKRLLSLLRFASLSRFASLFSLKLSEFLSL